MTIREIATLAGVSPTSVSLVLNHKKGVSEETRRRVQAVIKEHNYTVPTPKRASSKRKRLRICVVKFRTHGIAIEENQGFIASIIDQIESRCRHYGFDLTMVNCNQASATETLEEAMKASPDGVILMGTEIRQEDYPLLKHLGNIPTVVLDNGMCDVNVDSVVMDNQAISAEAVRYLYELGHRHIGYVRFNLPIGNCEERYDGYLRQMQLLKLPTPAPAFVKPTLADAYHDMCTLLAEGYQPPAALVADNDTVAIGSMKAIQEAGYRIPEDVSIIGVDDIPFSAITMPGLTTMHISRSAMGSLAVDSLRRRMKHPQWPSIRIRLAGRLVVRGSTRLIEAAQAKEATECL